MIAGETVPQPSPLGKVAREARRMRYSSCYAFDHHYSFPSHLSDLRPDKKYATGLSLSSRGSLHRSSVDSPVPKSRNFKWPEREWCAPAFLLPRILFNFYLLPFVRLYALVKLLSLGLRKSQETPSFSFLQSFFRSSILYTVLCILWGYILPI